MSVTTCYQDLHWANSNPRFYPVLSLEHTRKKKKISLNNGHTRNSIFARNSNNRFSSVRQQPGSIEHWFFKLLISLNEHIITVIQILFYSSSTVIFRVWLGYDELLDGSNTRDILHIPLTRLPLSDNFSNFFFSPSVFNYI